MTPKDRLRFIVRHELSRYDIPNEQMQQAAGQRQTADNIETMGIVSYQHTFSSHVVADFRGMVRDNANDFYSNVYSTPIEVFQHNWFREGYFKGHRYRRSWPPRMEVRRRVGQHVSERKFPLPHYRSDPIRPRHPDRLQLSRQTAPTSSSPHLFRIRFVWEIGPSMPAFAGITINSY